MTTSIFVYLVSPIYQSYQMQNQYQLEGSGFVFSFAHFMWLHDPLLKSVPCICMPDTIQFNRAQPIFWYYCRGNRMMRKGKERLNKSEIATHFEQNKREIVAVWAVPNKEHENKVSFEYLNLEQVLRLLESNDANLNGYLQEFVYPKGDNNFIIRAVWSENMCLMDHVRNLNPIQNTRIPLYQRLVTFECNTGPVKQGSLQGNVLPQQIETLCYNVANHIRNVTSEKKQVRQLELILRVNAKGNLVVLFCSFLKLKTSVPYYDEENDQTMYLEPTPTVLLAPIHCLPETISKKVLYSAPQQQSVEDFILRELCITCDRKKTAEDFLEVHLKELLEDWSLDHHQQEDAERQKTMMRKSIEKKKNKVKDSEHNQLVPTMHFKIKIQSRYQIPPIVRRLYPHMKVEDFQNAKTNEAFLNKAVMICSECFLQKMGRCRTSELEHGPYFLQKLRGPSTDQVILSSTKQKQLLRTQRDMTVQDDVRDKKSPSLAPMLLRFSQKTLNFDSLPKSSQQQRPHYYRALKPLKDSETDSNLKTSWHQSQSMTAMADLYNIYVTSKPTNNQQSRQRLTQITQQGMQKE